ncbi:component of gems protein 1-like isoform X2 [Prorops nasuta]|uniref:component of gems protein 1-like isoform X2 n=1 Tax=Prorops nasuta TaxID=863751 RepID=UPI0034CD3C79
MLFMIKSIVLFLTVQQCTSAVHPIVSSTPDTSHEFAQIVSKENSDDGKQVAVDAGQTSMHESSGHEKGETESHKQQKNVANYKDEDLTQKGFDKSSQSDGQIESSKQGKTAHQQHESANYKKGYHKEGFTNNYHKDESENKSSFYEDSDNVKGHQSYNTGNDYHGEKSQNSYNDDLLDKSHIVKDRYGQGLYDNAERYNRYQDHSLGHDDNRYYDDRRKYYDRNNNQAYYYKREPDYPNYSGDHYKYYPEREDLYYRRDHHGESYRSY